MISFREDFVKRANTHQTHFEDLVLLGPDGIDEIKDKIEKFIETSEGADVGLNTTTKIDGAPAVICYSKFTGYPDNSICLKSFVANANNVLSSEDEINAKYGDRPSMAEKLIYCLQLAPLIPAGEAWQGDCLFSTDDKKVEDIRGKEYITFQPNKIVYAFSEENPGYENVKNAEFGIAFHTVYKDDGNGGKSQSFRPETDKINWPAWAYIMSPALNVDKNNFNIDEIKKLQNLFVIQSDELIADSAYKDLINNEIFMQYWNTFENANIADKKQTELDPKTVINDLKEYVAEKQTKEFQKKFSSLKTNKGKMTAIDKWAGDVAELKEIINYNEETIYKLVHTLNLAARVKMMMWSGFKTANQDYSTFYKSRTKGIIDANMEGVAMSDADGNIVKIVDRSEFSSANRDPDIMAGWEHPGENIKESLNAIFGRLTEASFKNDDILKKGDGYLDAVLDDILNADILKLGTTSEDLSDFNLDDLRNNIENLEEKIENIRDLGYTKEALKLFNETFKDYFKWSQIFKGKYSGYDEAKLSTNEQESLQAIYLALNMQGLGKEITDNVIYDVKSEIYNGSICNMKCTTVSGLDLYKYKTQIEKLKKVLTIDLPEELKNIGNFTIVHPDGLDSGIDNKLIKKLFATGFKFTSDSGFTLDKDTFAPADIYVINLDKFDEFESQINALPKTLSTDDFVTFTNTLYKDGVAFPISLKMSANPKFYRIINSNESLLEYFTLDDITEIYFNPTGNSSMTLNSEEGDCYLEFRRKGESATSWQCNANIKGHKDALAGGSVKTYMKCAFESDMDQIINESDLQKITSFFSEKIKGNPSCSLGTGATSVSSQFGNIGLGTFCKELINHQESKNIIINNENKTYDSAFTYVIQHAFKKSSDIQNTLKIM